MKELKVSVDFARVKTAFRVKSTFDPSNGWFLRSSDSGLMNVGSISRSCLIVEAEIFNSLNLLVYRPLLKDRVERSAKFVVATFYTFQLCIGTVLSSKKAGVDLGALLAGTETPLIKAL